MTLPAQSPDFFSEQIRGASRFYLDLRPQCSAELRVVCGGREDCSSDFKIERPRFPYFALEFVARGFGHLTLAGRTVKLAPGSVFAYGGSVPHSIRTDPSQPLVKYFVNFVGRGSRRFLEECGVPPGGAAAVCAIAELRSAFDTLIWLGLQHDRRTAATCALQLRLLFHILARGFRRIGAGTSQRRARATFERVSRLIDSEFLSFGSVADIARACHVNPSHLSRLMRRFGAETPSRRLQRRKMRWAAERLEATGLLGRQIADELGMDPFQFSRAFKRIHGVAPTAFLAART